MVEVESAEKVARRTSRRRACNDKHGVTGDDTKRKACVDGRKSERREGVARENRCPKAGLQRQHGVTETLV